MRTRRVALLLVGILAFALSGCFGSVERPVAEEVAVFPVAGHGTE